MSGVCVCVYIYIVGGQLMLTFSSILSSQARPEAWYGWSRTKSDEYHGSPGTNLKHAMVDLKLQDGFTEVPKHVFWPQNRLEHQAGVGGLRKGKRKRIQFSNWFQSNWAGFQRRRLSRTQKPKDEIAQASWAAAAATSPDSPIIGGGVIWGS